MGSVNVAACLKEYSDDRMKDEDAYAFMARLKTPHAHKQSMNIWRAID